MEESTGTRRGFSIADIPLAAKVGAGVAAVVIVGVILVFSLSGSDGEPPAVSQAEAPAAAAAALPPVVDPAAAAMPDPETDGDQPPGAASATAPPAAQTPAAAAAGNQPARTAAPPRQAAPAPPPRPAAPAPRVVQRPAPTPPPRPAPEPTGPFRIGSDLERPTRTNNVAPIYPQAAQDAGIEGVVILETVISATGQVTDVNVLRSVDATVDEAAVVAARQWVYSPTLRNGVAVPVILTETVNFVLDNARAGAGDVRTAPPDRPASPSPTAPAGPIPVGGNIERPTRINDVAPLYPQVAQEAGIEGMVILQTEIATNGRVNNVTVLRSVDPILDEAAIAAARQWTYSPTLQNGVAVSVLMTETVNFVLPDAPPPVPAAGSIENTDPRALLGLTMGQVRNQVGTPQRGNDTTWTYDTSSGVVTLTFTDTADDGDFPNLIVTRVQSPQGTVRRMPR